MCQLTIVDLGSAELNKLYLSNQMWINSVAEHQDGYGIFQPGNFAFKSAMCAYADEDLGSVINEFTSNDNLIIGHVRRAASGVGGFKIISREKSHPFVYNNLVLFHNGVLNFKDPKMEKEERFKDKSDSDCFGYLLNEEYPRSDMVKSLNTVMDLFYGTFAFIIYSLVEEKCFISVGVTKKIYITEIFQDDEKLGIILNTNDFDLERSIRLTSIVINCICDR